MDIFELALHLSGIKESDLTDDMYCEIDDALYRKYGIDMDKLDDIVSELLPLIEVGTSPLSGTHFKGFAINGLWLVKVEI